MKLIAFDLDGTLAESKQPLTGVMAEKLAALLARYPVAILSGGALPQFLSQVIQPLPASAPLERLYLLPTSGASLYYYQNNEWHKVYEERISERDADTIAQLLVKTARDLGIAEPPDTSWGAQVEYRGGQVSYSALGQHAPVSAKIDWDPDKKKRLALLEAVNPKLPRQFHAAMGGLTTIDVTRRGVDKAYGLRKMCAHLRIPEAAVLYIGDELNAGGNDEVIFETNASTRNVRDPRETAQVIDELLSLAL